MPRIIIVDRDSDTRVEAEAPAGTSVLEIAQQYGFDVEGACEGAMACSTCHVIVAPEFHDRLPPPSEEEADMLDLTAGLTPTSRLGCQIELTDDLDGLTVTLPPMTRNMLGL